MSVITPEGTQYVHLGPRSVECMDMAYTSMKQVSRQGHVPPHQSPYAEVNMVLADDIDAAKLPPSVVWVDLDAGEAIVFGRISEVSASKVRETNRKIRTRLDFVAGNVRHNSYG